MNKHTNKKKRVKANYEARTGCAIKHVEQDGMPIEVATDLLCKSERMTNRMRKTCMAARSVQWESTQVSKPAGEKVAARLRAAAWKQLCRWRRRAVNRRNEAQTEVQAIMARIVKVEAMPATSVRQDILAMLDTALAQANQRGTAMETALDALETEIERRQDFISQLIEVAPSVAEALAKKME